MKRFLFLLMYCYIFSTCQNEKGMNPNFIDEKDIVKMLVGEYNNFQQCWQENTDEEIHRIEIEHPHEHIHSKFEQIFPKGKDAEDLFLLVTHTDGKDSTKVFAKELYEFWWMGEDGNDVEQIFSNIFQVPENQQVTKDIDALGERTDVLNWSKKGDEVLAENINGKLTFKLKNDSLHILNPNNTFANQSNVPYQMLRCRYFSVWIQYPLPENPDSVYSMRNLRIHDQGGIVQLKLEDGTPVEYTVELTQLVFGKKIDLMKLAIYEMPIEEVSWNSRASSYTWTSSDAKRLGINLRRVLSGWTLIEEGYISSNNTKFEKEE